MIDSHLATTEFDIPLTISQLYTYLYKEYREARDSLKLKEFDDPLIEENVSSKEYHKRMIDAYSRIGLSFFSMGNLSFDREDGSSYSTSYLEKQLFESFDDDLTYLYQPQEEDNEFLKEMKSTLQKFVEAIQFFKYFNFYYYSNFYFFLNGPKRNRVNLFSKLIRFIFFFNFIPIQFV